MSAYPAEVQPTDFQVASGERVRGFLISACVPVGPYCPFAVVDWCLMAETSSWFVAFEDEPGPPPISASINGARAIYFTLLLRALWFHSLRIRKVVN